MGRSATFHDLRHTYAMRLMGDPNLFITDVQRLMRHRSIYSTQIYARARIDDLVAKMREHCPPRAVRADPGPGLRPSSHGRVVPEPDMSPAGPTAIVEADQSPRPTPPADESPPLRESHSIYRQPVTSALRDRLAGAAVETLAARQPPSRAGLDPVRRSYRAVNDWLDWLETFPGVSYQEKWLACGAETTGRSWAVLCAPTRPGQERAARAFEAVICAGAIRPTYRFLFQVWSRRLWSTWREEHDQVLLARLAHLEGVAGDQMADVLIGLARLSIRTGKTLPQLTCDDLLEFRTEMLTVKGEHNKVSCATLYFLGRQIGLFSEGPEEFWALRTVTARSPAEIVAGYGITSPVMAGLLTEYLAERRPALDYGSFTNLAQQLCRLFWRDIELAHPGIDTHRLTRDQIGGRGVMEREVAPSRSFC